MRIYYFKESIIIIVIISLSCSFINRACQNARTRACKYESNTLFTRLSWLDELLYVRWTSHLDVCSMFARSCKRGIRCK